MPKLELIQYLTYLNTPTQVGTWILHIPNLNRDSLNTLLDTPLVRTSANYNYDPTKGKEIIPASSFSLMKCLSISTCFVLSCCTEL